MNDASHEFRVEPWGGLDREARYDQEVLYARRRVRRQVFGVTLILVAKGALSIAAYEIAGVWGVGLVLVIAISLLFIRGTHAFPGER